MLHLTLILCTLLFGFLWWFRRTLIVINLASSIPTIPGSLPIIGISHKLLGNSEDLWQTVKVLMKEISANGGVMKSWCGPFPMFGVTDPDLSALLLNTIMDKTHFYRFASVWLGDGLVTSSASTWRRHRKRLNPTFSQQMIHSFLEVFNVQSRILVEKLDQHAGKGDFEHWPYLATNALELICQTAFGLPAYKDVAVSEPYSKAIDTIIETITMRIQNMLLHYDFIFNLTKVKRHQDEALQTLKSYSNKILQERKKILRQNNKNNIQSSAKGNRFKSFLDLLLELGESGNMTDKEIGEEVDTMIAAGYDTTSTALLYILIVIGSYPEVQERIFQELQEVFNGNDRDLTKDDLPKLVYLEAVIKEAMRLYPVGPVIARHCDKDIKIENLVIPAGTDIFFFLYAINRNKCWGPDAETFMPERWLDPNLLPKNPSAYAVFSLGKRGCIGKMYAMVSLKTSLSHIIRKFYVKADVRKLIFKWEVLLKPTTAQHISLERR